MITELIKKWSGKKAPAAEPSAKMTDLEKDMLRHLEYHSIEWTVMWRGDLATPYTLVAHNRKRGVTVESSPAKVAVINHHLNTSREFSWMWHKKAVALHTTREVQERNRRAQEITDYVTRQLANKNI